MGEERLSKSRKGGRRRRERPKPVSNEIFKGQVQTAKSGEYRGRCIALTKKVEEATK